VYRKANLAMHERGRLAAGPALPTVTVQLPAGHVRAGVQLCREIRFPEQWACLAPQGAQLLIYLTYAVNPAEPPGVWRAHLISRAAETERFVLADLFSVWLLPTLAGGRRHKARTRRRASRDRGRIAAVFYRMRIYQAVPENLATFRDFFRRYLLPVQLRHGARLVGRWETEDGRVVAIWEYDDPAGYEWIEAAVRADPDSRQAQRLRGSLPPLTTGTEEVFMSSTVGPPSAGQRRL
jgi:hypothetical protein